jgi:hypothetical protein
MHNKLQIEVNVVDTEWVGRESPVLFQPLT